MKKLLSIVMIAMLAMVFAAPAMTASAGELSFSPIEDSYVRSHVASGRAGMPMQDYTPDALCISWKKNDGEDWEGWVYLKFKVAGIGTGKVDAASLVLTLHGSQDNVGSDVQFNVYKSASTWGEKTLTWNNKPAPDKSKSYGILKARGRDYNKNEKITIKLDPTLFSKGDGEYSLALVVDKDKTPFGADAAYYSKDQSKTENAPALKLSVTGGSSTPSGIKVKLNGKYLTFDQPPIAESGRTLVPLRAIFEAFGATVTWNQATQTVTAVKGSTTVKLTLGSKTAYKNGKAITLDVPAKAVNGRTIVPVRFISESFGATVTWDQATQTVIITYKG